MRYASATEWIFFVFFMTLMVLILIGAASLSTMSSSPDELDPGMAVVILSGNSIIRDGRPCQENRAGYVSATSPDGTQSWYKAERFLFPTDTLVSIIYLDGETSWVPSRLVVEPEKYEYDLCPAQ